MWLIDPANPVKILRCAGIGNLSRAISGLRPHRFGLSQILDLVQKVE